MPITVERESLSTKSRHVSPSYVDKDNVQTLASSDRPFPTVDVNHLRLHEGRAYYVYKMFPYSAGLGAGASIDIAIAWPADYFAHAVFDYGGAGEAEFFAYESPTTSGGTSMTIHRRNRVITTASAAAAVLAPTVTATGTEILAEFVPANKQGGGGQLFTFEFILKPLTTYLFRLTNVNSQAHAAHLMIEWYE
jgi:hypothetical protein